MLSKLLKNFRSHKDILEIPNKRFYEGELQACAERRVSEYMLQWEGLPCKGCPLLFHAVWGRDRREEDNPSYFNPEEIQLVLHYVDALLKDSNSFSLIKEEDIGIVSPYRQQVMKILAALKKRGRKEVTVGSTEQFQGRERLVIIITTVRSDDKPSGSDSLKSLGFLTNKKLAAHYLPATLPPPVHFCTCVVATAFVDFFPSDNLAMTTSDSSGSGVPSDEENEEPPRKRPKVVPYACDPSASSDDSDSDVAAPEGVLVPRDDGRRLHNTLW
ncbi:hypothetical protein HPB47_008841 [Ixodes persulcatus]|uniref:Uncharacterized protein n=1 Tax=Ixodes persulcatus TaxID=34615 RepID=A0AC60P3Y7_IXOPE|nr:hypothetical protein HPB47_008841 [Ixodes persulcatus]